MCGIVYQTDLLLMGPTAAVAHAAEHLQTPYLKQPPEIHVVPTLPPSLAYLGPMLALPCVDIAPLNCETFVFEKAFDEWRLLFPEVLFFALLRRVDTLGDNGVRLQLEAGLPACLERKHVAWRVSCLQPHMWTGSAPSHLKDWSVACRDDEARWLAMKIMLKYMLVEPLVKAYARQCEVDRALPGAVTQTVVPKGRL